MLERSDTPVRDRLARQRIELANELTRLSGGWSYQASKHWARCRWSRVSSSWQSGFGDSSPLKQGSTSNRISCAWEFSSSVRTKLIE